MKKWMKTALFSFLITVMILAACAGGYYTGKLLGDWMEIRQLEQYSDSAETMEISSQAEPRDQGFMVTTEGK